MKKWNFCIVILFIIFSYSIFKIMSGFKEYENIKQVDSSLKAKAIVNDELNSIDFEYLLNINPDVVGWVRLPTTSIDEPVLQGTSNDTYIQKDICNNESIAGAVFIDEKNSKNFEDDLTIMYGHHMKNGTRFADIKKFLDKQFFEENEYVYVYLPNNMMYIYQILAFAIIKEDDLIYSINGDYDTYVSSIRNKAIYQRTAFKEKSSLLLLSTCVNATGSERYVLLASRSNDLPF